MNSIDSPADPRSIASTDEAMVEAVNARMLALLRMDGAEDPERAAETETAATYHLRSGGQRVRARLAFHAATALGVDSDEAIALAATVELLHNASLIHDDIQDGERFRRGARTVRDLYGDHVAICAGDLLLSAAYAALASGRENRRLPELIALVHARTAMVIRGQSSELSAKGQQLAEVADYERIVRGKSGALLGLPLELAFAAAGRREWMTEARRAAEAFGIGYQIIDDLQDVARDAAGADGPRSVNILFVLRAAGHGSNAETVAREIGLRHLHAAIEIADRLPSGAGALLRELAESLCMRL